MVWPGESLQTDTHTQKDSFDSTSSTADVGGKYETKIKLSHKKKSSQVLSLLQPAIDFVRKQVKEVVPTVDANLVFSLLKMVDCFFASNQVSIFFSLLTKG